MGLLFRGGEQLQRGRGIGGLFKTIPNIFKPKEKKRKNKLAYDPNCKACQKYSRMLHLVDLLRINDKRDYFNKYSNR